MDPRGAEAGTELVLDNRKLILSFLLLIVVCGAFFVIGFMEGKRQAIRAQAESIAPAAPDAPIQAAGSDAKQEGVAAGQDRSVREQLDWYRSVQGSDAEPGKRTESARILNPAQDAEAKKPVAAPAKSAEPETTVTYSVQVGAFRQRKEADNKIGMLKARGFTGVIEPPATPDGYHLVKVGRFKTRAEAIAMELRLEKAGFSCFVKKN